MIEDWVKCKFEDLLDYEQPTNYIVNSTEYDDSYETPVLTAGKSFIKGYTNEKDGIFDNLPTIIFDDFTTASQFVNFKFKVKSSAMKILVPTSDLINMKFVYYAMQVNKVRSDTHKRYWISIYSKKEIFIPSVNEQLAIVAKIEELFSDLDKGVADLKKAQDQLRVYRQAVLKKAFEGDLTKKWRETKSILKEDWVKCRFKDLLDYEQPTNYIVNSTEYDDSYETPVLTAGKSFIKGYTNEKDGIFDNLPTIIFDDFTTASQFVNFKFKVKSSAMKILVPTSDLINMKFVYYAMQVNKVRSDTHKRYWISIYSKKEIFIPSVNEQIMIVQEIDSRLSVCDKVEESITESLEKAEALRQSILKKAFEGRLLSNEEIKKCKAAPDYEPAAVLLQKIKNL